MLSAQEIETLKANSLSMQNAMHLAEMIEDDPTAGGVLPGAAEGNLDEVDVEAFKDKWCKWWPVARLLLGIAKTFTGPDGDKVIDKLLQVGEQVCN